MNLSESSFQEIRKLIKDALVKYRRPEDQSVVTDIYVMPVRETGEISVYDDDNVLGSIQLSELVLIPEDSFYSFTESELRRIIKDLDSEQSLEELAIWKPFSFVLVDDERETITELMIFDEDNALLSQSLMQGLDDELEDFLKGLMDE